MTFEAWQKLSDAEQNSLRQKLIIGAPALLENTNNFLIYKISLKWDRDKDVQYLRQVFQKLKLAKITRVFIDDHLTDGHLIEWDESLERLFNYMTEFIFNKNKSGPTINANADLCSIFKNVEAYNLCITIMKATFPEKLTKRKGYYLFALVDQLKRRRDIFFNDRQSRPITDDELVKHFNSHLNTNFVQVKRNSKGFDEACNEIKNELNKHIKK